MTDPQFSAASLVMAIVSDNQGHVTMTWRLMELQGVMCRNTKIIVTVGSWMAGSESNTNSFADLIFMLFLLD
jgi:hypothetical protein